MINWIVFSLFQEVYGHNYVSLFSNTVVRMWMDGRVNVPKLNIYHYWMKKCLSDQLYFEQLFWSKIWYKIGKTILMIWVFIKKGVHSDKRRMSKVLNCQFNQVKGIKEEPVQCLKATFTLKIIQWCAIKMECLLHEHYINGVTLSQDYIP